MVATTVNDLPSDEKAAVPSRPQGGAVEQPYYRTDGRYEGSAPFFYEIGRFPWARQVEESWKTIRTEYEANLRQGKSQVVDVFNPVGPTIPGWKSVNLQTYRWRYHPAYNSFPKTAALLSTIPGLTSAFINVLEPNSKIPPHQGDSNTIVRFHLGLDVPNGDCGVQVGPETRRCQNGTMIAFCDAHWHSSWNATPESRLVMVFDVMRPEYLGQQRRISANVLGATVVLWLETKLRLRSPLPRPLRSLLRSAIGVAFLLVTPIQRRLHHAA